MSKLAPISPQTPSSIGDEKLQLQVPITDVSSLESNTHDDKIVLRKIDKWVLPLMMATVFIQYLDKSTLNYSNLLGLKEDVDLEGQRFAWLGSIFYFGYLFASPIHGYFLQKLTLAKYTATIVVLWGIVLATHAACSTFAGLMVVRFLLGVFEAGVTPAFILLVGRFYTSNEQIVRTCWWFSMFSVAPIFGGLILYAILNEPIKSGMAQWRQLFLSLGIVTVAFGALVWFWMPSSPITAKFLNEEERLIAVERVRQNQTGITNKQFKVPQMVEAFKDVRLYLFSLGIASITVCNGGITVFGSQIISSFGFSHKENALLGCATGGTSLLSVILALAIGYYTKTRSLPGIFSLVIGILGACLMIFLKGQGGRFVGYSLVFFFATPVCFYYSWLSSAIGGETKKIVFNTVVQIAFCLGNILGPQTFQARDAPRYIPAQIVMLAMMVVSAICMGAIVLVHRRENRKREKEVSPIEQAEETGLIDLDLTDKQRRSFRYVY